MTDPEQAPAALIEAGWQALEAGDIEHADDACSAALARLPRSIEVLSLQAAIALSRGALDQAVEICQRAISIDASDPRPYIQWAELCIVEGDDERAIDLAVQAIDRAGDESDFVDGLLIKAAAELGCERDDDARRTLRELDACVVSEPPLLYRLGELWLELGEAGRAQRAFESCLAGEPSSADAHHGIALAYEELGDEAAMLRSFRRVHELDAGAQPAPWHLEAAAFRGMVAAAIADLPSPLSDRLTGPAIDIEQSPGEAAIGEGEDPRLLGRFEGVPASHGADAPLGRVDRIVVYQRNLERAAGSEVNLGAELRLMLVHEYAQFFDLTDAELDALL